MRFALIDLGSNSARMYLLSEENGRTELLSKDRIMTRLSEGMHRDGYLKPDAMRRTVNVLKEFYHKAETAHATVLAVATAAVRKAKNSDVFCQMAEQEAHIHLHVISGEAEAYFDFHGVLYGLSHLKDMLIMDTGGGSTELILVKDRQVADKISLPLGAMSLTDMFLRDTADQEGKESALSYIDQALSKVSFLPRATALPIIGLGGSAAALVQPDHRLFSLSAAEPQVHGYMISSDHLRKLTAVLAAHTPRERCQLLSIEEGRADTILGGVLPTYLVAKKIGSPYMQVCTTGLREGILQQLKQEGIETALMHQTAFFQKIEETAHASMDI